MLREARCSLLALALACASCAAVLDGLMPAPADAHALESSLERLAGLGSTLELQSRFSSGQPAAGAKVSLVAPGGASLALGSTNAQGQLRFQLPAAADGSWEVRVDQGPGHRDYLELPQPACQPPTRAGLIQPLAWGGSSLLVLAGALAVRPRRPGASR